METTYSPAQVAHMTGASSSAVRNYATVYADHLSIGANPPKGKAKKFTTADVKLIAYVAQQTSPTGAGPTHETIKQQIAGGALDGFDGPSMVVPEPKQRGRKIGQTGTALATTQESFTHALGAVERLIAMGHEKEKELYDEVSRLNRQIGELQWQLGEATAMVDMLEKENERLKSEGQ